jgi:hypothetical protein
LYEVRDRTIGRPYAQNYTGEQSETTTAGESFTAHLPKGRTPIMTIKTAAAAIFAGAAAAIISAPVAAAGSANCNDDGPTSICTRNGHTAIHAEPRQTGSNLIMAPGVPFGFGNMPIMAWD